MTVAQLKEAVLALPDDERIELCRWVIETFEADDIAARWLRELERRSEEIVTGKIEGVTKEEFFAALDDRRAARR